MSKIQLCDDPTIFVPKPAPLLLKHNRAFKRAFDIVFCLLVLIFIFPWLVPILALLIRLESKGPVFFTQARTGFRNRTFHMFKFRTMTVNADCHSKQAVRGDRRITRLGTFLRKYSFDEIPQFINVLQGHMSVVGPRPHMLKHTEYYSKIIDNYVARHEVKPGITGWAQINGLRGPTETIHKMGKRVEHDLWYIDNWSFLLDLKCVGNTIMNMWRGEKNAV